MEIKPWDKLQDTLPPLSTQEEKALRASIAEHGVLDPILLLPSGLIIDGVHRRQIFKETKPDEEPPYTILYLDDETAFILGITLNIARRQMSPEQIKELQRNLKKDREHQKRVALALRRAGKSQEEAAAVVGVSQQTVSNWEQPHAFYCSLLASKLKGQREVQLQSGCADIITNEQVIEVEPIATWKHGLGQVLVYAQETSKQPALALFGTEPSPETMKVIKKSVETAGAKLLLHLRPRVDPLPGKLIKEWLDGKELTETQKRILRECGFDVDYKLTIFSKLVIPPSRVSIPKSEYENIYKRVQSNEPQSQIAADYKITQQRVSQIVKKVEDRKKHQAKQAPVSAQADLRLGDFTELSSELKDNSIPLILTDPPYGKEWLNKWRGLTELAYRVLSPGGFLITYSGQTYLPQVFEALLKDCSEGNHLNYFWTSAILLPQGNPQQFHTKVVNNWKPAIILTKGKPDIELLPWWLDVVKSQLEKDLDEWQQSVDIARYFVKIFAPEGATVLDPCAGTGTFLVAALLEGRNAYGYELDPEHYQIALTRLSGAKDGATIPN